MTKQRTVFLGIAAAAAIATAVLAIEGAPPVGPGTEAAVGAAKRYQSQQLDAKDVLLNDTPAHRFLQSETFARLLQDEGLRKRLADPDFRPALGDPEIAKTLDDPKALEALANPALQSALKNGAFKAALHDAHFAEAMGGVPCPKWDCGSNSPVVGGAAIAGRSQRVRAAKRYQAAQTAEPDVVLDDAGTPASPANAFDVPAADPAVASTHTGPSVSAATHRRLETALQDARARLIEDFGRSLNSPIVDGAAIVSPSRTWRSR